MDVIAREKVDRLAREATSILKRYSHYTLAPVEALEQLARTVSELPSSLSLFSAYSESSNLKNFLPNTEKNNNGNDSQVFPSSSPYFHTNGIVRVLIPCLDRVPPFLMSVIAARNSGVSSSHNYDGPRPLLDSPTLTPYLHPGNSAGHNSETANRRDPYLCLTASTQQSNKGNNSNNTLIDKGQIPDNYCTDGNVRSTSCSSPPAAFASDAPSSCCDRSSLRNECIPVPTERAGHNATAKHVNTAPLLQMEEVVGCKEAKLALFQAIVLPCRFPQLFESRRPPQRVLLYGPPGTGKTLLAQSVASKTQHHFFTYSAADLLSKWMGESEKQIRDIFASAAETTSRGVGANGGDAVGVILFFDEIDALCGARGTRDESETSRRIKTQFLFHLQQLPLGVKVVAATNLPWEIDSAVSRRFDRLIYVGLPSSEERMELLSRALTGVRHRVSHRSLERIAQRMHGFTASDVVLVVRQALSKPLETLDTADSVRRATIEDFVKCGVMRGRKRGRATEQVGDTHAVVRSTPIPFIKGRERCLSQGFSDGESDREPTRGVNESVEESLKERGVSEKTSLCSSSSQMCGESISSEDIEDDEVEYQNIEEDGTLFFTPCSSSHPNALHSVRTQHIPSAQLLIRLVCENDFKEVLDHFIPSVTADSVNVFEDFNGQKMK